MIAVSLYAEDLYSFEKLELDMEKYHSGVTMILGKNLDMGSANGAGKSAIIKILYYAIYGKDLKNTSVEKIIRRNSKGGSLVVFKFKEGKDTFIIQRYRNYKKPSDLKNSNGKPISGTGVDFFVNGEAFSIEKDPTKTESIIQSRIQTSGDMFKNSVLTEQKRQKNFLESDDSKKKEILIEMLNLDFYEHAQKLVKNDLDSLERTWDNAESNLELYKQHIIKKEAELASLDSKSLNFNIEFEQKLENYRKELKLLEDELPGLVDEFDKVQTNKKSSTELDSEIIVLSKKIKVLEGDISVEPLLIKKNSEAESTINRSNEIITANNTKIINHNEKIVLLRESAANLGIEKSFLDEIKNHKDSISKKNEAIATLDSELAKKEGLNKTKTSTENLIQSKEELVKKTESELKSIEHDIKCNECNRAFKEGESEELDKLVLKKKEVISGLISEVQLLNQKLLLVSESILKLDTLLVTSSELKKEAELLKSELTKLLVMQEKQEGITKERKSINNQIESLNNELSVLKEEIKKSEKNIVSANDGIIKIKEFFLELEINKKEYSSVLNKYNETKTQLSLINSINEDISNKEKIIKLKEEQIKSLVFNIKDTENNGNPYKLLTGNTRIEIDSYKKEIQVILSKLEKLKEEKLLLNFWKNGFSKTGIISFITEDVIKFLNIRIKEYLDILSDGNLSLVFSPESKLQKGTVSNKIETKMWINGEETLDSLNSGGELQRFVLTVDLALSDMVESRSPTHFNLKFLDEPFDGIDSSGQTKALSLFKKIAENRKGFFVISHDKEMQSFCDNSIYVIKRNDISKIVDKETFYSSGEAED